MYIVQRLDKPLSASVSQDDGDGTLTYFAFFAVGAGDENASLGRCIWDVAQTAPLFLNTIPYQIRLRISCEYVDHVVNGIVVPAYYATVKYGLPSGKNKDKTPYQPGDPEEWTPPDENTPLPVPRLLSVKLEGGSQNITTHVAKITEVYLKDSLGWVFDEESSGPGGFINVDSDGHPEGMQIDIPYVSWKETWAFPIRHATPSLLSKWSEYQYHHNKEQFRGFPGHSVLFTTWTANSEIPYVPDGEGGYFIPYNSETTFEFNFILDEGFVLGKDDQEIEIIVKGHAYSSPITVKKMVGEKIVPVEIGKRVQEIYDGADLNKLFEVSDEERDRKIASHILRGGEPGRIGQSERS